MCLNLCRSINTKNNPIVFMPNEYLQRNVEGETFLEVCRSRDVTSARGKVIEFDDEDMNVAIFRVGGSLYASSNICPHQHSPVLHDGVITRPADAQSHSHSASQSAECSVTCPLHGYTYSLLTGESSEGASKLKVYRVFEEDGYVYLEQPEAIEPPWRW
jgi:nitrite reductase/ring-hydroxylating ferredoxin subunit